MKSAQLGKVRKQKDVDADQQESIGTAEPGPKHSLPHVRNSGRWRLLWLLCWNAQTWALATSNSAHRLRAVAAATVSDRGHFPQRDLSLHLLRQGPPRQVTELREGNTLKPVPSITGNHLTNWIFIVVRYSHVNYIYE